MYHPNSYQKRAVLLAITCLALMVWLGLPQLSLNYAMASANADQSMGKGKRKPEMVYRSGRRPPARKFVPNGPAAVLYDQTANAGPDSVVSQNFEAAFDSFDSQAADDFIVPSGNTWTIQQVNVLGVYFNGPGPADSVNVTFYTNSGNLPGTALCTYTSLTPIDTAGDFSIMLPTPCMLNGGHYWVSVQANMNFTPNGEWGWDEQTVQTNAESAWQNPGGGFGTACSTWGPRVTTCAVGTDPDLGFQIIGTEVVGFDICLEDDSNGNILQINSLTGAYQFIICTSGLTYTGVGTLSANGCVSTFTGSGTDNTVNATIDACGAATTARALLVVPTNKRVTAYNIADSDTSDNDCACDSNN